MLTEYSPDVQKLFLEFMLQDAQSYVRVQNVFNPKNFDRKLQPVAKFIAEHSEKYGTLPERSQILATTGVRLDEIPDLSDGHLDWFLSLIHI